MREVPPQNSVLLAAKFRSRVSGGRRQLLPTQSLKATVPGPAMQIVERPRYRVVADCVHPFPTGIYRSGQSLDGPRGSPFAGVDHFLNDSLDLNLLRWPAGRFCARRCGWTG